MRVTQRAGVAVALDHRLRQRHAPVFGHARPKAATDDEDDVPRAQELVETFVAAVLAPQGQRVRLGDRALAGLGGQDRGVQAFGEGGGL